jgi:DNA topoisomerase I
MPKNLLIVESPAKAKTIEKYLGKDFTVRSSFGHIRDLKKNELSVDKERGFEPLYEITPDKIKVVKELREQAKNADEVWLATDEDREGEAISWHLAQVLGLDVTKTKRIVFREITKPAIQKAVLNPRTIDINLVDAQQARRVLDRLVGYELSEVLWKKVKGKLSAGRVQSVAVRLVVDREREITNFDSKPFFKVVALFNVPDERGKVVGLKAESGDNLATEADAQKFLERCKGANYSISNIEVKPAKRRPAPPFITSTLQQEASRKLGFSVSRTMSNAQRLYEAGFITYMRTDSVNMSETAIQGIADEITQQFGAQYSTPRRFKSKDENAQEAHEAIRPTYFDKKQVTEDRDQQRLYELIWKRALASQMADAELERTLVDIKISTAPEANLRAEGEVIKFDGFLKLYLESTDDEDEDTKGMLPPLKVGQNLDFNDMTATERFTRPAARYTEAGLVKKMEELGIGRPSTYAPTISRIMEEARGYVVKESRPGKERLFRTLYLDKTGVITGKTESENTGAGKNHLYPTDMGCLVVDFLAEHFTDVMDYHFTADIEKRFDHVAAGKDNWRKMIGDFYFPFHQVVEDTIANADRADMERILGKDPITGLTVLVRMGRYGALAQKGQTAEIPEGAKPMYANLGKEHSIESITFEETLRLFELPKQFEQFEGLDMLVAAGRFGPYVKWGDAFISLPKDEDPLGVTEERAIEIVKEHQRANAAIAHYEGLPVTKGTGRFGPFVKWASIYANIPRAYNIDTLTAAQALEILAAKIDKEANRYILHWPEEKIAVENGRWGAFIKCGKENINLPRTEDGSKMTPEQAGILTLEQVKEIIEKALPGLLKASAAKAPAKKPAAKKPAVKKK